MGLTKFNFLCKSTTSTTNTTITSIYHTPIAAYFTNSVINMPLPFDTVTNANKH